MIHDPMCDDHHDGGACPWCNFAARVREDERAAALRDAVEVVKGQSFLRLSPSDEDWVREQAVEAITDLGGER